MTDQRIELATLQEVYSEMLKEELRNISENKIKADIAQTIGDSVASAITRANYQISLHDLHPTAIEIIRHLAPKCFIN